MTRRIFFFLALVVVLDVGIGGLLNQLYRRTYTGERGGLLNYALTKNAEILVLGSSRAQYHVMPSVLHQTLSMTALNAGLKGHDFLYSIMLFDLWKRLHPSPKVILLEVDIESLLDRQKELEAAQIFSPYLNDSDLVRRVLYSADPYKRFEYVSRAYRFNGKVFAIAKNLFSAVDPSFDGFVAGAGKLNPATDSLVANALDQDATPFEYANRQFSEQKITYLRALSGYAVEHEARVFLFHPPMFQQDKAAHAVWVRRLRALIREMPAVDFVDVCEATYPGVFAHRPTCLQTRIHLNANGARSFSIAGRNVAERIDLAKKLVDETARGDGAAPPADRAEHIYVVANRAASQ